MNQKIPTNNFPHKFKQNLDSTIKKIIKFFYTTTITPQIKLIFFTKNFILYVPVFNEQVPGDSTKFFLITK